MPTSLRQVFTLCLTALSLSCDAHVPLGSIHDGSLTTPDGFRLAYAVLGGGPDTIVVVHGGPGLHYNSVRGIADALSDGHTVILYDQRGLGRSDPVTDSTRLTAAADVADLDAVRAQFHLGRLNLVAHHWGAVVATLYAAQHPDRVGRLLFVSPSFVNANERFLAATLPNDEREARAYIAAVTAGQDSTNPARFCRRYWGFAFTPVEVTEPSLVARLQPDMCDAPPAALAREARVGRLVASSVHGLDLRDTLARLRVSALILVGRGDSAVGESARAWAAALPGAQIVTLDAPALFPWLGDRRAFADALGRFMK